MARVKLSDDQVTLPRELRRALSVANQDELDAELVPEGVLLKRSAAARRQAALDGISAIQEEIGRRSPELLAMSDAELDEIILQEVKAGRREEREKRKERGGA